MKARSLLKQRVLLDDSSFLELSVWEVPTPVKGSEHRYKYQLAYVVDGACVMRFDNEAGKGDHCHVEGEEWPLMFNTLDDLLNRFWSMVEELRRKQS